MKTIGVVLRKNDWDNATYIGTKKELFDVLNKFSVNIICIPININLDKIINAINMCDGIILTGGKYVTDNDLEIVKYLYDNDIPTLGICLGMQSMGMAYNGRQEIKINNHNSKDIYVHEVIIKDDTLFKKIIGKDKILVNSRHNYAIPITNFKVNALSSDGVIEGIEVSSKRFFLGVQWHPESTEDENSKNLFNYFIDIL